MRYSEVVPGSVGLDLNSALAQRVQVSLPYSNQQRG
jgi:hypothetical protein